MYRHLNNHTDTGSRYRLRSRRGLTLIELVVAMVIAGIVGAMALTMFIFPQRIVNKGEKQSDIQFDLRMVSLTITDSSRLASGIEILPGTAIIPDSLDSDNHDIYLFVRPSDNAFIKRDQSGDRIIVHVTDLDLSFEAPGQGRTLSYSISGTSDDESFSLASQVLPLNLPQGTPITDSSGIAEGTIIRIENDFEMPDTNSLYFTLNEVLNDGVGFPYRAEFQAINPFPGGSLVYTLDENLLPPGLAFDNSIERISGIPTEAGQYQIEVHLTDGTQNATRSFVITIANNESGDEENLPTVSELQLSGTFELGHTVTGRYLTFTDTTEPSPLLEGDSTVIWYTKASPAAAVDEQRDQITPVQAGDDFTYLIQSADVGQYLYYKVIPANEDGVVGNPVASEAFLVETNTPPSVSAPVMNPDKNVSIGTVIEASFVYSDAEGDPMSRVDYTWYRSDKKTPSPGDEIVKTGDTGALTLTYTTTNDDKGKYISLELVPYATTGVLEGDAIRTDAINIKNK